MDDNYFVKISGTETIGRKVEEVEDLMRRFRRVKLELENIRKEKTAKRNLLLNQVNELLKIMDALHEMMPTKEKPKLEEKKLTKSAKKVVETVEEPMVVDKREVKKAKKQVDLSKLKDELNRLKKELEK